MVFFTLINLIPWAIYFGYRIGTKSIQSIQFDCDERYRAIFKYATGLIIDGKKQVIAVDPLEVIRAIKLDEEFDEDKDPELYRKTKSPALSGKICRMVMRVFNVQEWDGKEGMTESELMGLYWHFCDWVKKNAQNILPLPERQQLIMELGSMKPTNATTTSS